MTIFSVLLASIGGIVAFSQWFFGVRISTTWKQYEHYHQLTRTIVGADNTGGHQTMVDCQIAAIYEMRYFVKYYDLTAIFLNNISTWECWENIDKTRNANKRLLDAVQSTLDYINNYNSQCCLKRFWQRFKRAIL